MSAIKMSAPLGSGDGQNLVMDQVDRETREVFIHFVIENFRQDDPSQVNNVILLGGLSSQQNNHLAQIGRQLARIGDDVNKEYKVQFEQIANELDMSSETVYEKFSKIVISMLTQEANWGRILTLFCFGYYLACRFLRNSSFVQFFTRIIDCVIQFVRNHIAHWIISQGGWLEVASQNLRNERNYLYTFSFIGGMAVVLFAIYFLRKK